MRIGEILIRDGAIQEWQLEAALRTQQQYGGRLASNVVELGYVHVDVAARALGRQAGAPPALQKHFDAVDPKAIAKFSKKMAEKYRAVPIGFTRPDEATRRPGALIVVFIDPRQLAAVEEIAFLTSSKIHVAIAPEIRIAKCLERFYGITPANDRKFIRMDPTVPSELAVDEPNAPVSRVKTGSYQTSTSKAPPDLTLTPPKPSQRPPSDPLSRVELTLPPIKPTSSEISSIAISSAPGGAVIHEAVRIDETWSAERAARSITDTQPNHPDPAPRNEAPSREAPPARTASMLPPARHTLRSGLPPPIAREERSGVHVVDPRAEPNDPPRKPASDRPVSPPRPSLRPQPTPVPPGNPTGQASMRPRSLPPARPGLSAADAIRVIEAAGARDDVPLAVLDFLRSSFGCGIVFIARNDVAVGWKGFSALAGDSVVETLALPLTQPSILAIAYEARTMFRGAPPRDGDELHQRLYRAMRTASPTEAVVVPIVVS